MISIFVNTLIGCVCTLAITGTVLVLLCLTHL